MPNTTSRITVVEHVYHRVRGRNPYQEPMGFERVLGSEAEEQVLVRAPEEPLGCEWKKLDLMWVKNVGMIILQNLEKIPAGEIYLSTEHPTLQLAVATACRPFLIPPGEHFRFTHTSPQDLYMRSVNGEVHYSITVFPG